jgi:hypothetical protein
MASNDGGIAIGEKIRNLNGIYFVGEALACVPPFR